MTPEILILHEKTGRAVASVRKVMRLRAVTTRRVAALAIVCGLFSPVAAAADVVLDWNATAVSTMLGQNPAPNPFSQARFMAITQLAVFEAVNAVTGRYRPYLGTIDAPEGASAEAAAIAAAHAVLLNYFPGSATSLNDARASSLATIPDGQAKEDGIATGEAAAAAMILLRANDGSAPAEFFVPASPGPGVWEATPSCPTVDGVRVGILLHWRNVTPFGIRRAADFLADPPPSLRSRRYRKDYVEVMTVGGLDSTERPPDRADVARFYAASSPSQVLNHGRQAGGRGPGPFARPQRAGPGPDQHGRQRQPRRVVLDEISLQLLAPRDSDPPR